MQGNDKPKSFPFRLFGNLSAATVARDHLIKGILVRGETSAWIAPPGGLKSALLASAAIAVASGRDWHGRKNKGAAGVVYFALERADLVHRRLLAHGERLELTNLPIAVVSRTIDLMDRNTVPIVVATVAEAEASFGCEAGLLIFDTFAKLVAAGGGDEDKARDQGRVFSNLQRIKEQLRNEREGRRGAHIAIIGHTGKDESRGARGSNAILGDGDVMVTITGAEHARTAVVTKANDMPEGPLFSFRSVVHHFGHDEDGDPITVNIVSEEEVPTIGRAAKATASSWPKGLRLVRDCITDAMADNAVDHRVGADGPAVKAVDRLQAREVHRKRYVNTGEGDRAEAERKAWTRNFKNALDRALLSGEQLPDGQELIWLTQ